MQSDHVNERFNDHIKYGVPSKDENSYHVVVEFTIRMEDCITHTNLLRIRHWIFSLEISLQLLGHLVPSILKIFCKSWSYSMMLVFIVTEARECSINKHLVGATDSLRIIEIIISGESLNLIPCSWKLRNLIAIWLNSCLLDKIIQSEITPKLCEFLS